MLIIKIYVRTVLLECQGQIRLHRMYCLSGLYERSVAGMFLKCSNLDLALLRLCQCHEGISSVWRGSWRNKNLRKIHFKCGFTQCLKQIRVKPIMKFTRMATLRLSVELWKFLNNLRCWASIFDFYQIEFWVFDISKASSHSRLLLWTPSLHWLHQTVPTSPSFHNWKSFIGNLPIVISNPFR